MTDITLLQMATKKHMSKSIELLNILYYVIITEMLNVSVTNVVHVSSDTFTYLTHLYYYLRLF